MTRMSANRFERKTREKEAQKALKSNTCWDDLNQISGAANELMQRHLVIAGMMRNKELCAFLTDAKSVASNGKLLAKDIGTLAHELAALQSLHAEKTGGTDDPDVVMHTIGIYEQYQLFLERHEAVVMPTIGAILEQFHIAEERLNVAFDAGMELAVELQADKDNNIEDAVFTEVVEPARGQTAELVHTDESPIQEVK